MGEKSTKQGSRKSQGRVVYWGAAVAAGVGVGEALEPPIGTARTVGTMMGTGSTVGMTEDMVGAGPAGVTVD